MTGEMQQVEQFFLHCKMIADKNSFSIKIAFEKWIKIMPDDPINSF